MCMFLRTRGYKTDKLLTTAANCFDKYGVDRGDKRERYEPSNKLSDHELNLIEKHIKSFNPTFSHYRREQCSKSFVCAIVFNHS